MFSLLKKAAVRTLIGTSLEGDICSSPEDEPILSVNVEELRDLFPPLPDFPWSRLADVCSKTLSPVYNTVYRTLNDDAEHLAQLFAELDSPLIPSEDIAEADSVEEPIAFDSYEEPFQLSFSKIIPSIRAGYKRRRSTVTESTIPIIIKHSDPSLPTIIITPCPTEPRDTSCMVPYQDGAFGNLLTVPTHPVFNAAHPPLMPRSSAAVERWRFADGHWWAILPSIEDQMKKGLYSRPTVARRRKNYGGTSPTSAAARASIHRRMLMNAF